MKQFARHLPHYMALIGILSAGFIGLVIFSYDKNFQAGIALAVGISYVVWGVTHHYLHKDLHFEVLIEYLAVAALGITLLFSLILR